MTDWYAHVTVAAVVERDGRFLLVEEIADRELVLNQPAGHLDPGESLTDAVVRETLEETGWHVQPEGVLGLALYRAPGNGITYHRTTFYCRALRENPERELDTGIERALWMSPAEMHDNRHRMRSPLVLESLQQYLGGERYPLSLIYSTHL